MTDRELMQQPEALRLASKIEILDAIANGSRPPKAKELPTLKEAAAELRRLHEVNAYLIKTLDQLANGSHLDEIPNHSDDSLQDIAGFLGGGWSNNSEWAQNKLLAHAKRVNTAIAKATGEQQ